MEIIRKSAISYDEFIENHLKPGIPLVLTNASKTWKANGTFTPDWLKANFGERKTSHADIEYSMSEVIDLIKSSTPENPAPYPFLYNIPGSLPELLDYIRPVNLNYAKPNWVDSALFKRGNWGSVVELFIGGPGGKFPYLHLDYYHLSAWINQIYGEKQFTVFPRGQEEFLYPDPDNPWKSLVNMFEPDYEKHPKFKQATPLSFMLGPGETLYIPSGIWHSAYSLTPTISVAFDQLSSKNAKDFINDVWHIKKDHGKLRAAIHTGYAAVACLGCQLGDMIGLKR